MRTLATLLTAAVAAAPAWSQPPRSLVTNPVPPTREALDRLNLQLGWRARLATDGLRDGIATVQFLGDLVVVQTRGGLLVGLEAETGAPRWSVRIGNYPKVPLPVGSNSRFLFAVDGTRLFQIDRATGGVKAAFDLPTSTVTAPVADDLFLFISTGSNMVLCYLIDPEAGLTTTRPGEARSSPSPARPAARPGERPAPSALETRSSMAATQPARKSGIPPVQPKTNPDGTLAEDPRDRDYLPQSSVVNVEGVRFEPVPPAGGGLRQVAPSITVLPSVVPPYTLQHGGATPSITVVPSVVPPYTLQHGGATPSITVLRSLTELNPIYQVGPRPKLLWELPMRYSLSQAPVMSTTMILVPTAGTEITVVYKETRKFAYHFVPTAAVSGPLGQYESVAYIPTADGAVFALDIDSGRLLWRYAAAGPVTRPMIVTQEDVYLATHDGGLERVNRATGSQVWRNKQAVQLLAANPKFVYAKDLSGRLLVLGRSSGQVLASLDVSDFVVPITNQRTDRLLLAAHNGLILSLHDRDYPQPVLLRPDVNYTQAPPPPKKAAPAETPFPSAPATPAPATTPENGAAPKPAAPMGPGNQKPMGGAKPGAKPGGAKPGDQKPGDEKPGG